MNQIKFPFRLECRTLLPVLFALSIPAFCAETGFPFQGETLKYSVNWPSGLSLGEATLSASKSASGWSFDANLSAGLPGFTLGDRYQSTATTELCSQTLERTISHAGKKSREKTTFDQQKGTAHRVTVEPKDGGQSDFDISACTRDALTFIYFARKEMGQGRVAPAQRIYLGSAYSVRLEYTGAMTIPVADKPTVTDHVVAYLKGPKSDFHFELFFARDAARTPLLIKIPLSAGTFSMELVR